MSIRLSPKTLSLALVLATGCLDGSPLPHSNHDAPPARPRMETMTTPPNIADPALDAKAPGARAVQPPVPAEVAPPPTPRLADVPEAATLGARIEGWFEDHGGHRGYVQVDKPLYQPGETIWFEVWDLSARDLSGWHPNGSLKVQLIGPRGEVVAQEHLKESHGRAANAFDIPASAVGGEYKLKALAAGGAIERPIIVSNYEAPRLKKKLEFLRKAYGEGDEVTATIEVKRPTGEPLANHALTAAVRLDERDLPRVKLSTNADGGGLIRFSLPAQLERGDGLLTVLVEDGGVTESISKRIPIVLRRLQLGFFPEGGHLVEGLPSRLYFSARNTLGKPADVEGRLVDDLGNAVATFETYKNGLGRVAFTPATGRTYQAEITKPAGIVERYALPLAENDGCVLRTFDDPEGSEKAIRVEVRCTQARRVVVSAMIRERPIDAAAVQVTPDQPAIVYLQSKDDDITRMQGVARVTLFDENLAPIAERVVFRNRRGGVHLKVQPDRKAYAPRDQVKLAIAASDDAGQPLEGDLAMSVVDDTVISFADDKSANLLARLLLEPELPGKIDEPNFYFDLTEKKSAVAMDLLMGTSGYTTFAWRQVKDVDPDPKVRAQKREEEQKEREAEREKREVQMRQRMRFMDMEVNPPLPEAALAGPRRIAVAAPPRVPMVEHALLDNLVLAKKAPGPAERPVPQLDRARLDRPADGAMGMFGRLEAIRGQPALEQARAFAPVRVFPLPKYDHSDFNGPRTDFRETIYWNPSVKTDARGQAEVAFPLSDAVTSFRVFTEGIGHGLAGRDETVFKSSLPFSLDAKLPLKVSAGDRILMPLTLSNDRDRALDVAVKATFGSQLKAGDDVKAGGALAPDALESLFYPLEVVGVGDAEVHVSASTGSLHDEFLRRLHITPIGFPQELSRSGETSRSLKHELDLGKVIPGTVKGRLTLYPSPVATMVSGLEAMLREPAGCFEQTSSTNYPNVMIMQYLREHDIADAALLEKSAKLLDSGYHRLTGFESPHKGYEWFGGDPGHEALTAYGLVEFADMKRVYGGVDEGMVARTQRWLNSRRDGHGGFLRDPKALDSFGRASKEVTDAYITWSLALTGAKGFEKELAHQADTAQTTKDAYVLALATDALLHTPAHREEGLAAAKRLLATQESDGSWTKAAESITHSGGTNLTVETTSLALLALLDAGGHQTEVRHAVAWLNDHRGGFGQWGATQATVLALKAMTAYANASRQAQHPGKLTIYVNGEPAGETSYPAGRHDPVVLDDFGAKLHAGRNVVEIRHEGDTLPYTLAVTYRSTEPASSAQAVVGLSTSLEKTSVKMGETVRLNAVVRNTTAKGQPMTLARVGIPAGLSFQTWQLKELREQGKVAFWETHAREVDLYFRDLAPSEEKRVPIDLVATVPGSYTAPASSAYLYYDDDHKAWAPALRIDIAQ